MLTRLITCKHKLDNPGMCSPWGVFEVDVENMRGVERGLDWVLHHLAKKR